MKTKLLSIGVIGIFLLTLLLSVPVPGMRSNATDNKPPNPDPVIIKDNIVNLTQPAPGQLIIASQVYFKFSNRDYAIALFGSFRRSQINDKYVNKPYYYEWTILNKKTNELTLVDGGFFCGYNTISGSQHISKKGSWYEFTINVYDHKEEPRNLLDSDSCVFYQLI